MIIIEKEGFVLRQAKNEDMPRIDEITIICYTPIHEIYQSMLGEKYYEAVRHDRSL